MYRVLIVLLLFSSSISKVYAECAPVTYEYYTIAGKTAPELEQELRMKGPKDSTGKVRDAEARWYITWRFIEEIPKSSPFIKGVEVGCNGRITLPRWTDESLASPPLQAEWRRYSQVILAHEHRHIAHAAEALPQLKIALEKAIALGSTKDELERVAQRELQKVRIRDLAYDSSTDHGRREGVFLKK